MSFLYPLFLAGITVVGLPIILHMIRRHTRKRVRFSSLMFLRTTIPRFKNRSRLENLLLLILRCTILCLLAFGFARPFFPRETLQDQISLGQRIVLLIDTSASMRRTGTWNQVISEAQSALRSINQTDRVCIMSFDQNTQTLMSFEQWGAMDSNQQVSIAIENISKLSPSWATTNLGNALVSAAEAIEDDEINDNQQTAAIPQIVLISDLQQGSNLEAMNTYEWPQEIELAVKLVSCPDATNAALHLVTNRDSLSNPTEKYHPRIRITNSPDANTEQFQLKWTNTIGTSNKIEDIYVPGGHNIVVSAPDREDFSNARKLVLTGDDHDFDNNLYLAPYLQQQVNILYIGNDDPNDSKEMLYYVQRAFGTTGAIKPRVTSRSGNQAISAKDIETAHLIIATDIISSENHVSLRRYLESGRTLLLVMKSADTSTTITSLSGIKNIKSEEANVNQYVMFGRIEFKHPLLTTFSEPRFGDFTQIHFWKYRRINIDDLSDARVLASFDNGDPVWIELPIGKGSLLVLTCGWHPSDSQLALSSKFVPLLYSILEYSGVIAEQQPQYFVGDNVPIPQSIKSRVSKLQIRKPDGSLINLNTDQQAFNQTDLPGIYSIESSSGNRLFAINLGAKECQTTPMPIENIERFGVPLMQSPDISIERTIKRRNESNIAGLEYEQKVWRWVFIILLAVSFIEIWLAGRLTGLSPESKEE
jgi:uncharacterized protein YegL